MKKLHTFFFFLIIAVVAFQACGAGAALPIFVLLGTITADGNWVLQDGTKALFATAATIDIAPTYIKTEDRVVVDCRVTYSGTQVGGITMEFDKATVVGYTASGADEALKFYNQCEQAVDAVLEALTDNSGVTFTIS